MTAEVPLCVQEHHGSIFSFGQFWSENRVIYEKVPSKRNTAHKRAAVGRESRKVCEIVNIDRREGK